MANNLVTAMLCMTSYGGAVQHKEVFQGDAEDDMAGKVLLC